jgi:hypothetical protein
MPYRRKWANDAWHWCRNCSNWPVTHYNEESSKPESGSECSECQAKEREGSCQS